MTDYLNNILWSMAIGTSVTCAILGTLPTLTILFWSFVGAVIGYEIGVFIKGKL